MIGRGLWNSRGSILIAVLILLSVLFLLGSSLLRSSLIDTRIAMNHLQNLRAYNYALSGVEMALGILQEDPNFRGEFARVIEEGKVEVTVEHLMGQEGAEWLKVSSAGTVKNLLESIFLQFKIVPATPAEALPAAELGWIDEESGEMQQDAAAAPDSSVKFSTETVAPLSQAGYEFLARDLYFEADPALQLEDCRVELAAESLVFRGMIILEGENACLCLRGPGAEEVRVQFLAAVKDQHYSILVEPGTYLLSAPYQLTPDTQTTDLEGKRIFPMLAETKLWGKKPP